MPDDSTPTNHGEQALRRLDALQSQIDHLSDSAAIGAVAGMVAHEVRNILTPAIAYVQLALGNPDEHGKASSALERSLVAMRRACEASELVIACMRAAESAPEVPHPEPCTDVAAVIRDCVESLGWNAATRPFALQIQANRSAFTPMPADALRHVLMNLLLNARASLPECSGVITIIVGLDPAPRNESYPTGNVRIEIVDNGRGIEPARLQTIRDALTKRGRLTHPSELGVLARHGARGSGLGLFLCNQLLVAHDAELRLEPGEISGTRATVIVPAQRPVAAAA